MTTPGPVLVERFRQDFAAALGRPVVAGEPIALAVSGGPDSMAMLVLAHAAHPGQIIAATVDHGLRADARAEAAMVARYCAALGVAHATLTPDAPIPRANLHANARAARYRLLEHWAAGRGAQMLATAHHTDDQAETFLMRAARGSGVSGLAGVRMRQRVTVPVLPPLAVAPGADGARLDIIRPLLGWRVGALRAVAMQAGAPFVDDPSNTDPAYDRTGFRALLGETALLDAAHLARSAAHMAEADAALRTVERWLWQTRKVLPTGVDAPDREVWLDTADVPRELKRRLSRAAIEAVRALNRITRPDFSAASNIEALLDALEAATSATHAGVMASRAQGDIWRFRAAPPRRSR